MSMSASAITSDSILLTDSLIVVCIMGAGVGFLSYLTAMADAPLRDRELLAFDRALGFDWSAVMHALDQWPGLASLLELAYQTHTAQIACIVMFLALRNRPKDLDAFLLAFLIAGALTTTISALVPALGPASLLGNQDFLNLKLTGATPADVLAQLRAGSTRIIDLDHMAGIVTFPSFHTAIALLVVHAVRRDWWLLGPVAGLDALMLASTITEGGHLRGRRPGRRRDHDRRRDRLGRCERFAGRPRAAAPCPAEPGLSAGRRESEESARQRGFWRCCIGRLIWCICTDPMVWTGPIP